jgi:hypothetical protein
MMDKMLADLISLLCKSFPDDPSSPSLLVSYLLPVGEHRERAEWYVSILRYQHRWAQGKRVEFNYVSEDLNVALRMVGRWIEENCKAKSDD